MFPVTTIICERPRDVGAENTPTCDACDREAESLAARYESATFEDVHGDVLDLLPDSDGLVLDFHIAFHIGRLSATDPNSCFHIISKDTGFDSLIEHLKTRKIYAQREKDLAEIRNRTWRQRSWRIRPESRWRRGRIDINNSSKSCRPALSVGRRSSLVVGENIGRIFPAEFCLSGRGHAEAWRPVQQQRSSRSTRRNAGPY
ncbi:MAG: PIN domain-containing protein [Pseudomonadota bacterium]|nr:PIN domain-containing protein [Pseudomonadota bacterium]